MAEPVRVLWLVKGLGRGGAEMLLVSLAKALDRDAIDLSVGYVLPHKDALVPDLEKLGVHVHELRSRSGWVGGLRRLLSSGQFDVVHTHSPVVGSVARLLVPRSTPMFHTEHNMWDRYRRPTRWLNQVTLRRNHVVWAVSHGVERSIRPRPFRGPESIAVMIHGIDLTEARPGRAARPAARRHLQASSDEFVIGTVGNLTAKKDHETLLRAFARVLEGHPHVRLVIIGSGPREATLRALVRELGLSGFVVLLGSRDDVPALLPGLDLFALSSRHEGLSIALIEALAAGLPVVATDVGGIPEVVQHEVHGLLVPAGDAAAFAGAVTTMIESPDLRRRCSAQATTRSGAFSITKAADELRRHYLDFASITERRPL